MRALLESLAGRAALLDVWPLSLGEQTGVVETFLDHQLRGPEAVRGLAGPVASREDVLRRVVRGGYPEPLQLTGRLRDTWFDSYVETVTRRDLGGIATVRRPADLVRLLRYLAGHTAHELVTVQTANEIDIERGTLAGYLSLLEQVFLVTTQPAWSRNPLGKVVRRPKTHLVDSGLACSLFDVDVESLLAVVSPLRGQLLESYVYNELLRQQGWAGTRTGLHHWRDSGGAEVDVVVETRDGRVAGVEVKASATVGAADFRWLSVLRDKLGDAFIQGVVLYLGPDVRSFGPGLTAVPVSLLAGA